MIVFVGSTIVRREKNDLEGCTILALAAICDLDIIQFGITSAYLRTLKEDVYVEQPEDYVAPGKKGWVCVGTWNLIVKRSVRRLFGVCSQVSHSHILGYLRAHILVIESLRVCSGPQQTRSFSSDLATKRKF